MSAMYIIIENAVPYPTIYTLFISAIAAVKEKYKYRIAKEIREADGGPICSEIDVPENTTTRCTCLYIEKDIHIYIYKLQLL